MENPDQCSSIKRIGRPPRRSDPIRRAVGTQGPKIEVHVCSDMEACGGK